jgi:hypothetical protein
MLRREFRKASMDELVALQGDARLCGGPRRKAGDLAMTLSHALSRTRESRVS